MRTSATIALGVILLSISVISAQALVPGIDPNRSSRTINERAEYRAATSALPSASSSARTISASSRLGEYFPKTTLSPSFSGRVMGPIRLEQVTNAGVIKQPSFRKQEKAAPVQKAQRTRVKTIQSFGGTNEDFPTTFFTPTYQGRWTGTAKLQ